MAKPKPIFEGRARHSNRYHSKVPVRLWTPDEDALWVPILLASKTGGQFRRHCRLLCSPEVLDRMPARHESSGGNLTESRLTDLCYDTIRNHAWDCVVPTYPYKFAAFPPEGCRNLAGVGFGDAFWLHQWATTAVPEHRRPFNFVLRMLGRLPEGFVNEVYASRVQNPNDWPWSPEDGPLRVKADKVAEALKSKDSKRLWRLCLS